MRNLNPASAGFLFELTMLTRSSINIIMNRLTIEARTQILSLLCEGSSLRSVTRVTGTSLNTVSRLLIEAGKACAEYQDRAFRELPWGTLWLTYQAPSCR